MKFRKKITHTLYFEFLLYKSFIKHVANIKNNLHAFLNTAHLLHIRYLSIRLKQNKNFYTFYTFLYIYLGY